MFVLASSQGLRICFIMTVFVKRNWIVRYLCGPPVYNPFAHDGNVVRVSQGNETLGRGPSP